VVCYPSLWEGYGLPVAEAMGAGAPVVTSAGTATEELVAGGAGLAVDPLDVDAIAGAIASVLDDDALAARLRSAGRERAAARTWQATAEATIAAYDEAARP
jgi:glycosyltransferase involved in cell wall biosynthesis